MTDQRPYAALLAKGEDRRQRILAVAQRLLSRQGSRGTTIVQIAREAGVTPAGLLHHFESKEQLLHAVLDARDAFDEARADRMGDIVEELERVAERYREAPELVGLFSVLQMENIEPGAPLHDRFRTRYWVAVETLAEGIRRGQRAGRYRTDLDPTVKSVEIVAFITGIQTSWLLDPSIPLTEVFTEYTASLTRQLAPPSDTP
ncbi:TetR/AcrR family transcriptional regulator [Actinomadura parmotrematis]|uniref:TetR/AcrR family transcriptional regulator n=1 Tax=Actinomadura parmotrematis TaxID=2864039 RepID=A0ABS7FQG4_9ACTN|nr:TetR/AcrR family transcriptional regulator [Actinomadura parmotrematis]MBW8482632.1 TetR/AcrR family transcriptional regulator [Actinomadura parmotrematis]